jgi:LPS export ABC transporter protein LptC
MLKDPRNLLWLVPLAALMAMPLWKPFVADFLNPQRSREDSPIPSLTATRSLTSSEMKNVHFEQNRNGVREWAITASSLHSAEGDADLQLANVFARFFGAKGSSNRQTDIRSQKARYNRRLQELRLQGEVVIQNDKGYEMRAESLVYLEKERKIQTDSEVIINGKNLAVRGESLVYDVASGNYRLEGNVICKVW